MGKQSGLGDQLVVGGWDLGDDIGQVNNISGPLATLPATGITKEAFERIGGKRDGAMEYTAFFNPSPGRSHERLSKLPTGDQLVTYLRGAGAGRPGACLVGKQIGYDGSRGDDGSFTFGVQTQGSRYGLEWGVQLTDGVRTDVAATDGPAVDLGAGPTAHGAQLYLHVLDFTGTDATVTVQESADGIAWTDVVGGAFGQVMAGRSWQRLATARDQAVQRYLRASTTGTFTSLSLLVVAVVNPVEVTF